MNFFSYDIEGKYYYNDSVNFTVSFTNHSKERNGKGFIKLETCLLLAKLFSKYEKRKNLENKKIIVKLIDENDPKGSISVVLQLGKFSNFGKIITTWADFDEKENFLKAFEGQIILEISINDDLEVFYREYIFNKKGKE